MLNPEESRVLGRIGARELSIEEFQMVSGAHTNVCTAALNTGTFTAPSDGDGCGDFDVH